MSDIDIEDTNLKLAIVSALMDTGSLPPFDRDAWLVAHPPEEDPDRLDAIDLRNATHDDDDEDDDEEDYRSFYGSRDLLAELRSIAVASQLADTMEELNWDDRSGSTVRQLIWPYWDGECDTFDIQSLAGIEQLRGLRRLRIQYHGSKELDLSPLLSLPLLARVQVVGSESAANIPCVAALKARGVVVVVAD